MLISVPRSKRRPLVVATVTAASALVLAVGAVQAADQRLADADNALEKGAALLDAALQEQDPLPTKVRSRYDKALQRAIARIDDARPGIATAQSIAGGGEAEA